MAKSRKEAKESEPGKSGKSRSNKEVSTKQNSKCKKPRKDDMEEPLVHFGRNEVGYMYREERGDNLEIFSESDNGDVTEVRERDGHGELGMVEIGDGTNREEEDRRNREEGEDGTNRVEGEDETIREEDSQLAAMMQEQEEQSDSSSVG